MKILVATNHLVAVGGSELYTYDLIKSLKDRSDCTVEYFTFGKGEVSAKIEKDLGVSFMTRKHYDLILANHVPVIERLYRYGPIIQICHGVFPPLEQPSPHADFHIAISEETAEHLAYIGVKKNRQKVILNGLDIQQKSVQKPVNLQIQNVLSLCQSDAANDMLLEICRERNWNFTAFNKHVNPTMNIETVINANDVVIGIGRSVYDAMACGRPCIIFDDRSYNGNMGDGYLEPDEFDRYVINNCSGRYTQKQFDKASLMLEFMKYDARDGIALRRIAEQMLDMDQVGDQLISLLDQYQLNSTMNRFKKLFFKLLGRKRTRRLLGWKKKG